MLFEFLAFFLDFSLLISFILLFFQIHHVTRDLVLLSLYVLLGSFEDGPLHLDLIHLFHNIR